MMATRGLRCNLCHPWFNVGRFLATFHASLRPSREACKCRIAKVILLAGARLLDEHQVSKLVYVRSNERVDVVVLKTSTTRQDVAPPTNSFTLFTNYNSCCCCLVGFTVPLTNLIIERHWTRSDLPGNPAC
jgi:hypothetical protein